MKKILLSVIVLAFAVACRKTEKHHYTSVDQKCGSYKDGVESGKYPDKTTTVMVKDTVYTMDYVRDHDDKWPAFSSFEAPADTFSGFLKHAGLNGEYPDPAKVHLVTFYAGTDDIEKAEMLQWEHIAAYSVTYRGDDNFGYMRYTDVKRHTTATYKVSNAYASVKNYFLRERAGVTQNPSIVEFSNTGFNSKGMKLIDINDDTLYAKAQGDE